MFGLEIIAIELLAPLAIGGVIAGYKKVFGEKQETPKISIDTVFGYLEDTTSTKK